MKPTYHAESSAKKWGGTPDCYLKLHDWMDQSKAHFPTNAHRCILHSSFGIFLGEQVFGHTITNSEGKKVSVRDIFEQHVLEDLNCIPTVSDYLMNLEYQPWMNGDGLPPSMGKTFPEKDEIYTINQAIQNANKVFIDGAVGEAGGCKKPTPKVVEPTLEETFNIPEPPPQFFDGSKPFIPPQISDIPNPAINWKTRILD